MKRDMVVLTVLCEVPKGMEPVAFKKFVADELLATLEQLGSDDGPRFEVVGDTSEVLVFNEDPE